MIGRRRARKDESSDTASPWATDTIEIDDTPAEFDWTSIGRSEPPSDDDLDAPAPRRRNKIIGAAAAAGLLLVVATVLWPRDDGGVDDAGDADAAPTTLGALPDAADDNDGADEAEDTPATTDSVDIADEGDPGDGGGEILAPPATDTGDDRPSAIAPPVELAGLTQPTEIVMATSTGITTLSLPSGRLTYSPATDNNVGGSLVVAPDATAFTSGTATITVIPRIGTPFTVDEFGDGQDGFVQGWTTLPDGTTAFQVESFGPNEPRSFLVALDGEVIPIESRLSSGGFSTFDFARSNGRNIINDAGGVYLASTDGSVRRIATGRAFAASGDFLLLRECDEALTCQLVVENYVTAERRVVDPSIEISNVFALDLSPDGTAVSTLAPDDSGMEQVQVVDLDSGAVLAGGAPGATFFSLGSSWLPDSSGTVQVPPNGIGLTYLDRTTGALVEFGGDEIGRINAIGLRYPESELPPATTTVTESTLGFSDALTGATGLDVVVIGPLGTMALLDIDDGTAAAWSLPDLAGTRLRELVQVRDAVAVMGPGDEGYLVRPGSAELIDTELVDLGEGPRYPGPAQGLVWAPDAADGSTASTVDHRLRSIDGSLPTTDGSAITIPDAALLGGDSRGGLVAEAPGGVYAAAASGTERLTTGALLALGANHALVRECDELLQCRTLLIDRATGERSTDFPTRDIGTAIGRDTALISSTGDGPVASTISPDGALALTRDESAESGWVLHDFSAETSAQIPEPADRQPFIWSDDSSSLVYLSDEGVLIYERQTALIVRVQGLGDVDGIVRVDDFFTAASTE